MDLPKEDFLKKAKRVRKGDKDGDFVEHVGGAQMQGVRALANALNPYLALRYAG